MISNLQFNYKKNANVLVNVISPTHFQTNILYNAIY